MLKKSLLFVMATGIITSSTSSSANKNDDVAFNSNMKKIANYTFYNKITEYKNESLKNGFELENNLNDMLYEFAEIHENNIENSKILIEEYSKIYGLNNDVVYQIISDLTNNFTSQKYLDDYLIEDITVKNIKFENLTNELSILLQVRNIYFYYSDYGYTLEEITAEETYESIMSYESQIKKYSQVVGVDFLIVYTICKGESNFNSDLFNNKNNPAGIRFSGKWAEFPSKTAGIIDTVLEIKKYNEKGQVTLEEIGLTYAPASEEGNNSWLINMESIYQKALETNPLIFEYEENSTLLTK